MTNLVSFQESSDGSTHIIKKKLYQSHRLKDRNHIIISLDTEKVYDKTHHPLMMTSLEGWEWKEYTTI